MKKFIVKYKTQIISIITAISALALALTSLGGEVTRVCEIVIAIDAVLIAILKTGFDNKFVDNSVALLKLLQEQYDLNPTAKPVLPEIAGASSTPVNNKQVVIKHKDGSTTILGNVVSEAEAKLDNDAIGITGVASMFEDFLAKQEAAKGEKLTDEQLKELVESYLHPATPEKEADNSEEKAE